MIQISNNVIEGMYACIIAALVIFILNLETNNLFCDNLLVPGYPQIEFSEKHS